MKLRRLVLIAALSIGQSVCAQLEPREVGFARLSQDDRAFAINSEFEQARELIVRDQTSWEAVWERIHSARRPLPPPPEVDFAAYVAVVVTLGQMRSGGYDIIVSAAVGDGGGTLVSVLERRPAPTCAVTMNLTSPVDIAIFPRTAEPLEFRRIPVTSSC